MNRFFWVAGLLVSLVYIQNAFADGIREGKWSMTMVTKMEGMDKEMAAMAKEMENMPPEAMAMMQQMQGQMGFQVNAADQGITTTVTQCITNQNPVPDTKVPEDCEQTHDIKGNTVNFHVVCNKKNMQMDSTGHVTYQGDSMEGVVKSHQVERGKATDATIQMTGKYLGPC